MERQIQPDNLPGYWPARVKSTSHTLSFVSPASCVCATSGGNLVLASSTYHNSNMISRPICFHPIEKTSLGHSAGHRARDKPRTMKDSTLYLCRSYLEFSRRDYRPLEERSGKVVSKLKYPHIRLLWSPLDFKDGRVGDPLLDLDSTYVTKERDHGWKIVSKREERRTIVGDIPVGIFEELVSSSVDHRCLFEGDWLTKYCEIRFPNRWILQKIFIFISFVNNNKLFE